MNPICICSAPPGTIIPPAINDVTEEFLTANSWREISIGPCPDREQPNMRFGLRTLRRQYGLQPYISNTIHSIQGANLWKLATQLSAVDERYRLWEKGQLVVVTSCTNDARSTIFVGNKEDNLAMMRKALYFQSQYTEYMDHVLETMAGVTTTPPSIVRMDLLPYRACDTALPRDITGFSYLLVSVRDWTMVYIGETLDLH